MQPGFLVRTSRQPHVRAMRDPIGRGAGVMDDLVEGLRLMARRWKGVANYYDDAADEIERLRGVIDCGTNAIRGVIVRGGGDLERIDAMQRRMRREMFPNLRPTTSDIQTGEK